MSDDQAPKIHIDSDWKAEAQKEKQRLSEKAAGGGEAGAAGEGGVPEASFDTLVNSLATQALFAMGAVADPRTGQRFQNLDIARHHTDMLGVLEEKCKGNLTEEEENTLAGITYELRSRYIQMAQGGGAGR